MGEALACSARPALQREAGRAGTSAAVGGKRLVSPAHLPSALARPAPPSRRAPPAQSWCPPCRARTLACSGRGSGTGPGSWGAGPARSAPPPARSAGCGCRASAPSRLRGGGVWGGGAGLAWVGGCERNKGGGKPKAPALRTLPKSRAVVATGAKQPAWQIGLGATRVCGRRSPLLRGQQRGGAHVGPTHPTSRGS